MLIDLKNKLSLVKRVVPLDGLRETALNAGTLGQSSGHSHEDHGKLLFLGNLDIGVHPIAMHTC